MGDQHAKASGVVQDPAHDLGVHDRPVSVGDVDAAGLGHESDLGHPLTPAALGRRASGQDIDQAGVPRPATDEVHDRGFIDHGVGVGLDDEGGHPARRRGLRRRTQGLAGLKPGFAGLDPEVDEAGDQEGAPGVEGLIIGAHGTGMRACDDRLDDAVPDEEGPAGVQARSRIDDPGVEYGQGTVGGGTHSWNLSSHFSSAGGW